MSITNTGSLTVVTLVQSLLWGGLMSAEWKWCRKNVSSCLTGKFLTQQQFLMSVLCRFSATPVPASLHCALAAAQCIVIVPVYGFVCVFVGLLPR